MREIVGRIPAHVTPVAVFVNPSRDDLARVRELFPQSLVQFSGDESPGFARFGGR